MIRLVIAFLCATAACVLVAGAFSSSAQAPANTAPDLFVTQMTRSVRLSGTNPVGSFVGDTSANGRFVVIESNGDIATEKTATRHNQDGNREIFLFDYAQRRVFQVTNTRSVLKPAGSPSPTPSPSPSPSVSPSPTPSPTPPVDEPANVAVEISNNRPQISLEPLLVAGERTYTIVFSSNSPTLGTFDGAASAALTADGNQEVWVYRFAVPEVASLSSGADVGPVDLTAGTFTRITDTPASRAPSPGADVTSPFIADDNRDAAVSDNGQVVSLISTRNLAATNADANPEVFLTTVGSGVFTQVTNTTTTSANNPIFSSSTCLSSDGSVLAFVSNANLTGDNDDGGGIGNAEIYIRDGAGLRQVTKTRPEATGATALLFSFGRRLSRDGKFISFESIATDPSANGTNTSFYVSFVYNVVANTFAQLGPRATNAPGDPVLHVPVFTDYNAALSPGSVMFTSGLNFKSDGTFPTEAEDSTGLNPARNSQIFVASLPVSATGPFTRMTTVPTNSGFAGVGAFPSASRKRFAFSRPIELGLGNGDGSVESFYQLTPDAIESNATLTLFTGATRIPVPVASPTASPNASPTPSPSPSGSPTPFVAVGLAAGELAFVNSSGSLAPASATVSNANASESKRSPALPIELNGVSISISDAACGLYAVSSGEIKFVVPIGVATGTHPIVINNNGTVIRGLITIVAVQPDIFSTTDGPLGRASVCNITNPAVCTPEPFFVTTDNGTGTQVPTTLRISLTGVRNANAATLIVTVGTTILTPSLNTSLDLPGIDQLDFTLSSTVTTGDVPIVVALLPSGSSRTADTAPRITINAGGSPLPNPISGTDFFVRQQYLDFLGREPDAAGFAFWKNQIDSCGFDQQCIEVARINVSAAFFLSIEFQQTGYLVYRTYKAAFGNIPGLPVPVRRNEFLPDTRALAQNVIVTQTGWENTLEQNKQAFMADFVQRPQFTSAYPSSLTAEQFVNELYAHAGIAPASGTNHTAAISEFSSTTPADAAARARALRLVAEDPMLVQQEFNAAFVLMEYFGYLGRNPYDPPEQTLDFQGYNFWLNKLNAFNGDYVKSEMVKAFLDSIEYRQRFGS